jgi:formate hydrogenlyase subunit 6/NADH:ubiquinone oxidoreductase subunit I
MANPLTLPMIRRSLRNLVARPATRKYPYEVRPSFGGARGKIEFDVTTCNYCMLCMRRCPAEAIKVSREDRVWSIEHLRCIACNVCVEVCSKKSLSMSNQPRKPQTPADGVDGQRPGHEEWHLAAPDTTGTPCPDAEAPAAKA